MNEAGNLRHAGTDSRMARVENKLDEARGYFAVVLGEPRLTPERTLLREILFAMEAPEPDAIELIGQALQSGNLRARSWSTGSIIPTLSWPEAGRGWIWTTIDFDHECRGHVGELPYVERATAIEWIIEADDRWAQISRETDVRQPPSRETRPNFDAEREREFLKALDWWQSRGIRPKYPERLERCPINLHRIQRRQSSWHIPAG